MTPQGKRVYALELEPQRSERPDSSTTMPIGVTLRNPAPRQHADAESLSEARAILAEFADALGPWDPKLARTGPRLHLNGASAGALAVVHGMLGEGAMTIEIARPRSLLVQETTFAGVWRICRLDACGEAIDEWLEAAAFPELVTQIARDAASPAFAGQPRSGIPSAVLERVGAAMRACTPDTAACIINLTLPALTPEDRRLIDAMLPAGPVAITSRGFGLCRIHSTRAHDVWRVQYFNGANSLVLDTLEIVQVPEIAVAAIEDLDDTCERLADLVDWMDE